MLRDERQTFLNDLIVANQETVAAYEQTLETLDDGAPAETCRSLLASCEAIIERLEACIKSLDDLPNAPDEERELLRATGRRVASILSPRPDWAVLVEALIDHEQKTIDLCRNATNVSLPETAEKTVADCEDRAVRAIDMLRSIGA